MDEPLGVIDPNGWAICHGCEVIMVAARQTHSPDCPGLCVRRDCPNHPKV